MSKLHIIVETAVDRLSAAEAPMGSELAAFVHADPMDETTTYLIARLARCLAALPGGAPDAHSGSSNYGF